MPNAHSDETERALNLRHQSASPRFGEMRVDGYIDYLYDKEGNIVMRPTRSGKGAKVHTLTRAGRDAVKLGLPIRRRKGGGDITGRRSKGDSASRAAFNNSEFSGLRLKIAQFLARP